MKFKTARRGSVTVIELQGNLMGGPDAATLNNKLHELTEAGKKLVVVDLSHVKFMNSSGLSMLIGALTTIKNAGGKLKLANASEKIMTVLKITKLSSVFENYPSVQAAVGSFKE
jgi:anti-sigma B factor antagonist